MEKVRKLNKKAIIALCACVVAVVLIIVLVFALNKPSNKKKLENSLTEMGRSFYENFYYEQVGTSADERSTLLSKFTDIGIKVDLDNLNRYNDGEFKEEIKKFKNNKKNEDCNKTNTKVIIYPKSPYGKTDYTVKAELDCGFEEK